MEIKVPAVKNLAKTTQISSAHFTSQPRLTGRSAWLGSVKCTFNNVQNITSISAVK